MKYEMIFGDQKRFNEQNNEMAEVMLWHDCLGPNFVSLKELSRMNLDGAIPHGSVVLAMRRIIPEPKRWTWEDKKAGRLPEVGRLVATIHNFDCTVVGVDEERKNIAIQYENGKLDVVRVHCVSPIETPEEKAQREEDEFVGSLSGTDIHDGTVKDFFAQGARAAYRKLKGGE